MHDVVFLLDVDNTLLDNDAITAMESIWGERLTTVFVRQGHYARDVSPLEMRQADLGIDAIADMPALAFMR